MTKKKVLVTGLNGVVGSAIRPLFEEKYDLSSFSRYGCDDIPEEKNLFEGECFVFDKRVALDHE